MTHWKISFTIFVFYIVIAKAKDCESPNDCGSHECCAITESDGNRKMECVPTGGDEPTSNIRCLYNNEDSSSNTMVKRDASENEKYPDFPNCGLRSPIVDEEKDLLPSLGNILTDPLIVGGEEAEPNSWPWMGALFVGPDGGDQFICGASLLSRRYVLTAAHCFNGFSSKDKFAVELGAHDIEGGTKYSVEKFLIHKDYDEEQLYNDICLLTLEEEVTLNKEVYPVCLSNGDVPDPEPGEPVTVTGWGRTSERGSTAEKLQEVTIPVVSQEECNRKYEELEYYLPNGVNKLLLCAGEEKGGKDACQGDSGGPLVYHRADDTWMQVGVVAAGIGCARKEYPGLYTRVSEYIDWIYENTDLGSG